MITLSISWIPVTEFMPWFAINQKSRQSLKMESTMRTSWMANNAIPDSIIMNMTCRSLVPPVEPKVCSTEVAVALTSKNTMRILNTIKPVTRVFTAMDKTKLVRTTVFHQAVTNFWSCINITAPFCASQITRGNKLKSVYQTRIRLIDLSMRLPRMKE